MTYAMATQTPSFAANVTRYSGGIFRAPGTSAVESDVQVIFPTNKTVSMLTVKLKTAQPVGTTLTVSIRKNGAATGLQVTIAGGATAGTVVQDNTNAVAFVALVDLFGIEYVAVGPAVSAQLEDVIMEIV